MRRDTVKRGCSLYAVEVVHEELAYEVWRSPKGRYHGIYEARGGRDEPSTRLIAVRREAGAAVVVAATLAASVAPARWP